MQTLGILITDTSTDVMLNLFGETLQYIICILYYF